MDYKITTLSGPLSLITLAPPINGFNDFIGTWVYQGKKTFIVDVGPSVTAGALISALTEMGIKTLDHILLTHIHIDHAGGIGELASAFPGADIVCHPKGIPHLVDPEKLVKGSIKTLGETGRIYGPIQPVEESRFIGAEVFTSEIIKPLLTPGHAPHHVSYNTADVLFAGETGGVSLDTGTDTLYLRPATPPRFFMETAMESIDKLISLTPDMMCYGHYGMQKNGKDKLKQHKAQLNRWYDIIKEYSDQAEEESYHETVTQALLEQDPLLKGFHNLDDGVKEREKYFLKNSINGFTGYIKEQNAS